MPLLNVNRQGHIQGTTNASFSTARTSNSGIAADGAVGNQNVQFFVGRGAFRFSRVFLHFDTSGITGTVTAAHINIQGGNSSPDPNDTIIIKSTAFGGDGGTALATSDMFSSLDYSTPYSSELTGWNASANNEYTLVSAALTDIKNNNNFTVAIINHDADFSNTNTGGTDDISIDFDTTITLDYTLGASSNITSLNTIARASITSFNTIALASIDEINTIS